MTESSLQDRIGDAYAAHQQGRLDVAERQYRALLAEFPQQVDVLYLLSSLQLASAPGAAAELAARAVDAASGDGGIGVTQAALHDHHAACLRAAALSPEIEADALQRAHRLDPRNPDRLFRMADALRRAGDVEAAISVLSDYLVQRPNDVNARANLGGLQFQAGRLPEAAASLQKVLKAKPNHAEALANLGNVFSQQERLDLAVEKYRQAVAHRPDLADAWYNLAGALQRLARPDEALAAFHKVVELDPHSVKAHDGLNSLYVQVVPRWHFVMMNDRRRNEAYDQAIRRQVGKRLARGESPLVLDIGAGSGLLSMMAARAGAGTVVTCEMVRPVADKAREIIAANGYAAQIALHAVKSTCLEVGKTLPRRADILVTEIFDAGLLGECVLATLAHARQHLLAEGATLVPGRARLWMMPIESQEIHDLICVDNRNACGFDLESFNLFARRGYDQLAIRRYAHAPLAEPRAVFDFDFNEDTPDRSVVLDIEATRSGMLHAWVSWFTLYLDEETAYDTGPYGEETCWAQAVQAEPRAFAVAAAQTIRVRARHTRTDVRFSIDAPAAPV